MERENILRIIEIYFKRLEAAWTTLVLLLLVEAEQGRVAGVTWSICEPGGPYAYYARAPIQKTSLELKIM